MPRPGDYRPDAAEGIDCLHDLPTPHRKARTRNRKYAPCPQCRTRCPRRRTVKRLLRDIGNHETGRPVEIEFTCSVHRCSDCEKYFNIDLSDIADLGSHYTRRVVDMAVRYRVRTEGNIRCRVALDMFRDLRLLPQRRTILCLHQARAG